MKVIYRPEDGDEQEWEYRQGRMRVEEAQLYARRLKKEGGSWPEFEAGVLGGDPLSTKILLFHLMRHKNPELKWEYMENFWMEEVEIVRDLDDDKRVLRRYENMPRSEGLQEALDGLQESIAEREAAGEGKANSIPDETSTGPQ